MTMPTSTSRSIWKALAVRFLFLTSVSSFVFYTTWRSPEKSRLRNTALDDLLVTLDNPQISPLPGGGFCNYLYHIQDGRNEVRENCETKRGSVSAVCQWIKLISLLLAVTLPVRCQDILRYGHAPATYIVRCSRSASVRETSGAQNNIAFKEWSLDGVYKGNNFGGNDNSSVRSIWITWQGRDTTETATFISYSNIVWKDKYAMVLPRCHAKGH